MSTLVTIAVASTAKQPVQVLVQSIVDGGRERMPNGMHEVEPGAARDFLIDEQQCLRVGPETAAA